MASFKRCDICGKEVRYHFKVAVQTMFSKWREMEVCASCYNKTIKFFYCGKAPYLEVDE